MRLVDLADELGLTTSATLDLCERAGVDVSSGGDELSEEDVVRLRTMAATPPPAPPPAAFAPMEPQGPGAPSPPPPFSAPTPGALGAPPGYGPPSGAPGGPAGWGQPPPYVAAGPWGHPPGTGQPPAKTDGFAIGAIATALFCFPVAWALGIISLGRIRRSEGALSGKGLVYGAIGISIFPILILAITFLGESVEDTDRPNNETSFGGGGDSDIFDGMDNVTDGLGVGDCYQLPKEQIILDIDVVSCDELHDLEVYEVIEDRSAEGADYPGDLEMQQRSNELCAPGFEEFVGRSIDESTLILIFLYPQPNAWSLIDDRTIVCSVGDVNGRIDETLEGADR